MRDAGRERRAPTAATVQVPGPEISRPEQTCPAMDLAQFRRFRQLIHQETGIWLRDGKQVMLASRLSRRLRHLGIADFAAYYAFVEDRENSQQEISELINCVTTNKTSFFRENHHFDFLARKLVPEMQQAVARGASRSLRIWSAACSTGQEPYSIAICLLEALAATARSWDIRLIASDIDTAVLATAAGGIYDLEAIEGLEVAVRQRYFLRGTGQMADQVKVKPAVAALIEYQRLNLNEATWSVSGPFDAIFFRNALIYFDRRTQELFLRKMVRLLRPGGYLFLGHSEHVPWLHDVVDPLQQTIYQRKHGCP